MADDDDDRIQWIYSILVGLAYVWGLVCESEIWLYKRARLTISTQI